MKQIQREKNKTQSWEKDFDKELTYISDLPFNKGKRYIKYLLPKPYKDFIQSELVKARSDERDRALKEDFEVKV